MKEKLKQVSSTNNNRNVHLQQVKESWVNQVLTWLNKTWRKYYDLTRLENDMQSIFSQDQRYCICQTWHTLSSFSPYSRHTRKAYLDTFLDMGWYYHFFLLPSKDTGISQADIQTIEKEIEKEFSFVNLPDKNFVKYLKLDL